MAEVLIVGGGPVGLYLAVLLLQHGVRVRVIERRTAPAAHSRAIGIHPPALAALQQTGVGPQFIDNGIPIRRGIALAGGRTLAAMSFDRSPGDFPYILSLPQARTEAILEQRVRALDAGALERGVWLTGLLDDGGRVRVRAMTPGGPRSYTAPWVIAADGVRSTVREVLGTAQRSRDHPDSYLMGDFSDTTDFGPDAALFLSGDGIVESFPLPGGRRRWVVRLRDRGAPGTPENPAPDVHWLARTISDRTGATLRPETSTMVSGFSVRTRLARAMVAGRTVLIGDAAHEISPIGGQGMNLGWLDAAALAPLLVGALRGREIAAELHEFERARLHAAMRAAAQANINMALGRPLPAGLLAARNTAIAAAAGLPAINALIARRFTMQ